MRLVDPEEADAGGEATEASGREETMLGVVPGVVTEAYEITEGGVLVVAVVGGVTTSGTVE